jgi:ATP-binding cassette, subfamily F, member 2
MMTVFVCAGAVSDVTQKMEDLYACAVQRAVTGTLSSHPDSRDLHIDSLSITFHGVELLVDTRLELNNGRRYGLIGLNGCGKARQLTACS